MARSDTDGSSLGEAKRARVAGTSLNAQSEVRICGFVASSLINAHSIILPRGQLGNFPAKWISGAGMEKVNDGQTIYSVYIS